MKTAMRMMNDRTGHFVYIALCADGTLYTGYTNDVAKRIKAHNAGEGAKYTRPRLPVRAVYTEVCMSKGEALKREARIKKLRREKKLQLIAAADDIRSKRSESRSVKKHFL
jgi:putative endonuclease